MLAFTLPQSSYVQLKKTNFYDKNMLCQGKMQTFTKLFFTGIWIVYPISFAFFFFFSMVGQLIFLRWHSAIFVKILSWGCDIL